MIESLTSYLNYVTPPQMYTTWLVPLAFPLFNLCNQCFSRLIPADTIIHLKVHGEQIVLKEKKKKQSTMSTVSWACCDESLREVELSNSTCWEHRVLITAGQIITCPPSISLPLSLSLSMAADVSRSKQTAACWVLSTRLSILGGSGRQLFPWSTGSGPNWMNQLFYLFFKLQQLTH